MMNNLDAHTDKFLKDALPTGLNFKNEFIPIEELIKVYDKLTSFTGFIESLKELTIDTAYELYFPKGVKAKLSIGISRVQTKELLGYSIEPTGKISPYLDVLEENQVGVVGFKRVGTNHRSSAIASCCAITCGAAPCPGSRTGGKRGINIHISGCPHMERQSDWCIGVINNLFFVIFCSRGHFIWISVI